MELPVLQGGTVVLRPPRGGELEALCARIAADPMTNVWWGASAARVLGWLTAEGVMALLITCDDGIIGVVTAHEETDPDYRSAGLDIAVLGPYTGRGLGVDALTTLARWLFETRGHHRLTIDPALDNARATRAYEKAGFERVGVMRRYERGPDGEWRDGLLMDMLEEDLRSPAG